VTPIHEKAFTRDDLICRGIHDKRRAEAKRCINRQNAHVTSLRPRAKTGPAFSKKGKFVNLNAPPGAKNTRGLKT
jgi:hypothetical protein